MVTRMRKKHLFPKFLLLLLCFLVLGCIWYVNDYYRADAEVLATLQQGYPSTITIEQKDDMLFLAPTHPYDTGFIFYPGGKVDYLAYSPLLIQCAEKGIFCAIIKMPANLAVFDIDAAENIISLFPEINHWYIGGHSLGGAMASSHIAKYPDQYRGLILLGAYPSADLNGKNVPILSLYGSNDMVINSEKYATQLHLITNEFIIDGGNHAYFGSYGEQEGDGTATITPSEQQSIAAQKIFDFIFKQSHQ